MKMYTAGPVTAASDGPMGDAASPPVSMAADSRRYFFFFNGRSVRSGERWRVWERSEQPQQGGGGGGAVEETLHTGAAGGI